MKRLSVLLLALLLVLPLGAATNGFGRIEEIKEPNAFQRSFLVLHLPPHFFFLSQPLSLPLGYWAARAEDRLTMLSEGLYQPTEKLRLGIQVLTDFQRKADGSATLLEGDASLFLSAMYQMGKDIWVEASGTLPVSIPEILLEP